MSYRKTADEDDQLQSCSSLFDIVFYVPLRHAKQGVSTVVDLVCDSVSGCDLRVHQNMKQTLLDDNIPCLVILDGLDEWNAPDTCRVRGFPDSDDLVNCTLLYTMRPWRMFNLRLGLDSTYDKVVNILGLQRSSVKTVIKNVLVNFYGFDVHSPLYKQKFKYFCANAKLPGMKSLLKIPLMLTSSCLVWNEEVELDSDQGDSDFERDGDQGDLNSDVSSESDNDYSDSDVSYSSQSEVYSASYFMTFFYIKLMEITITRAKLKYDIVRSFLWEKQVVGNTHQYILHILSGFNHITEFLEVIKPIGRLALQDLVSDQTCLVFPIDKLERDIGHSKVELALKAGILSQSKAPGLSYQQKVRLRFYHKSIQEFIAALYMIFGDTEALTSFCTNCYTVEKVMQLSNMIQFVCGLDPKVGCQLSEHVREVVNSDADIMQYRKSGDEAYIIDKAEQLYNIQCKWYSEMKQNLSYTHGTDRAPNLHVTDVYLDHWRDRDDVRMASELVSMEDNSIVSVYLSSFYVDQPVAFHSIMQIIMSVNKWEVHHPLHSIIQHLSGYKHLIALHVIDIKGTRSRKLLAEVLPKLVQLQYVAYGYILGENCPPADTAVVRAVQQLPALIYIELSDITLTDAVTLPPQIQEIVLIGIQPAEFILPSLSGCPSLTSLRIAHLDNMEDCELLVSVLPKLPNLQRIHCNGYMYRCRPSHAAVVSALQHLTRLTHIELMGIDLEDAGTLLVAPHMTQLQKVELWEVEMSPRRWSEFLSSLQHATKLTHIKLSNIDLDDAGTLLVTPQMTQLQKVEFVEVKMTDRRWMEFFSSLQHATKLNHITLQSIDLGDNGTLLITPHMTQLQKVELEMLKMSARSWREFLSSLLSVQNTIHVTLKRTNIDDDTMKTLHSSKHLTVTEEDPEKYWLEYSLRKIVFHTVQ